MCVAHTGVSHNGEGVLAEWLSHVLNAVTGRLDAARRAPRRTRLRADGEHVRNPASRIKPRPRASRVWLERAAWQNLPTKF